jgi:hypothetical protein
MAEWRRAGEATISRPEANNSSALETSYVIKLVGIRREGIPMCPMGES